jgi:membrane-associated protease RseP (regulator of RpoE activity)
MSLARGTLLLAVLWGLIFPASRALAQGALDRVEKSLRKGGEKVEPGYLGAILDDRLDRGRGIRVRDVVERSPADAAGLKANDLIIAIGQSPVRQISDLSAVLQELPAGSRIAIEVVRGSEALKLDVVLGQRPPPGERRFENFGRIPGDDRPIPNPPPPLVVPEGAPGAAPPARPLTDAERIEQLERRLAELERRLAELEERLKARP